jgi:hypothetical protein
VNNIWRGTIAHVSKISSDRRVIDAIFLSQQRGILPLINAETQEIVGTVDAIGFNHDRAVLGSGRTSLPPGEYTVGIDLDHVESETEDGSLFRMTGRLIALHVNRRPAWPDVKITVEAA